MLKRFISDYNYKGVKATTTSILVGTNVDVSQRMLANWRSKHEFKYKKGAQKLQLNAAHKKIRVEVISAWIHKNIPWEKAVFTDEKRFTLAGPDNW